MLSEPVSCSDAGAVCSRVYQLSAGRSEQERSVMELVCSVGSWEVPSHLLCSQSSQLSITAHCSKGKPSSCASHHVFCLEEAV